MDATGPYLPTFSGNVESIWQDIMRLSPTVKSGGEDGTAEVAIKWQKVCNPMLSVEAGGWAKQKDASLWEG